VAKLYIPSTLCNKNLKEDAQQSVIWGDKKLLAHQAKT
jgi:hypothetical protein